MSLAIQVELNPQKMPTRKEWQAAISANGFPLLLGQFDPHRGDGVIDCTYSDEPTSFEYYYEPGTDSADFRVNTSSGDAAWSAASAAAATLTLLTSGTLTDPQSGETRRGKRAIAWARPTFDDDRLTKLALALPHVDSEFEALRQKLWWRLW